MWNEGGKTFRERKHLGKVLRAMFSCSLRNQGEITWGRGTPGIASPMAGSPGLSEALLREGTGPEFPQKKAARNHQRQGLQTSYNLGQPKATQSFL